MRGLATCLDGGEGSSRSGREGCVAALKKAASLAPNAPRPLAELGWAMLRNGGDGSGARATRLLERAAELTATGEGSVPPDVEAKLGVARWTEAGDAGEAALQSCARGRGPNTAHASLLAAAAVRGPFRSLAFAYLARMYDVSRRREPSGKVQGASVVLRPGGSDRGTRRVRGEGR